MRFIRRLAEGSGFRRCKVVLALCLFTIAPVYSAGLAVNGSSPAVISTWLAEYDSLSNQLSHNGLSKQMAGAASIAANPQSLLFPSDKKPLDVILRRTQALLDDQKKLPGAPNMSAFENHLHDLMTRSGGLAKSAAISADKDLFVEASLLRRQIALANPLLTYDSIMFNRWTSRYQHIQEGYGNTLYNKGGLFMLSGLQSGHTTVRNLLTNVAFTNAPYQGKQILSFQGAVRSFDLSYDAKQIVFAWTPYTFEHSDGTAWPPDANDSMKLRICVMNVDGTGLKTLTDGKYNDLDPAWLPNGRIIFVSGRNRLTVRCNMGPYAAQTRMYSMNSDGSDVTELSYHETMERYPAVDNSGKIQYTRWDYIDRDMCAAQCLWQCNPDGTNPRSYHANYPEPNENLWYSTTDARTKRPWAEYWPRPIPGSNKIALIAASHHSPPYGLPCIIDLGVKDDNATAQIKVMTPGGLPFAGEPSYYTSRGMWQGCAYISIKNDYCYWEPWPLSETYFLIPYGVNAGVMTQPQMGAMQENFTTVPMQLYLLDAMGNRTFVDSCSSGALGGNYLNVRPYRARTPAPIIPTQTCDGVRAALPEHTRASLSILNVYDADITLPKNVSIKKLRIVQVFPRTWEEPNIEDPHTGWSEGGICRASMGTVPVEKDGSVYCDAPVNKGLYFQLLDSNGCAVQTMRSLTYIHPGEHISCTGCHEDKWAATPVGPVPIAFQRAPSTLTKEPGSQVPVTYGLVAPIFQNNCLPCHKSQNKGLQNFAYTDPKTIPRFPDTNGTTNLSDYCWWNDASNSGDCLGPYGGLRSNPYKFGFMYSRLGRKLMASNTPCKVADTLMQKVKLWMDLNCMQYGNPTHVQADVTAQLTGSGSFTWPVSMSTSNPTGVELNYPQPTSTSVIEQWEKQGAIQRDDPFHMIRFVGRNLCEISGFVGPASVRVIDIAGRTVFHQTFSASDKQSVFRFPLSTLGGKTAAGILFVNLDTGAGRQTERFVNVGGGR